MSQTQPPFPLPACRWEGREVATALDNLDKLVKVQQSIERRLNALVVVAWSAAILAASAVAVAIIHVTSGASLGGP